MTKSATVTLGTPHSWADYTDQQILLAATVAYYLGDGSLILLEPPER